MMTCYDDAMRTIVDLPDDQIRALKDYCARKHISRAEAVRRAIAKLIEDAETEEQRRQRILKAAAGIWPDRRDAREIVDEWRAEWDHRP